MRQSQILIIIFFTGCFISCTNKIKAAQESKVEYVSMIQLISSPERYDNKRVVVSGIFSFEFEDNNLYLTQHAFEYHDFRNAIEMSLYEDIYDSNGNPVKGKLNKVETKYRKYHAKYVRLKGIFNHAKGDPLRPFRLTNIRDLKILKKR